MSKKQSIHTEQIRTQDAMDIRTTTEAFRQPDDCPTCWQVKHGKGQLRSETDSFIYYTCDKCGLSFKVVK